VKPRLAAGAAALLSLSLAARASAVEREHHLGLDAGGSLLDVADKNSADVGGGVGAHWTYGLSDAFNLMAEGAWSLVAIGEKAQSRTTPTTRPTNVTNAGIGLGYVLDVLQWVPYAGVLLGGYALNGGTIHGTSFLPGIALGIGLDYRFGRSWAAGVAIRQHLLVTDMSTYPTFTQVFARCEYTWGW
jgi:hypothetical protein